MLETLAEVVEWSLRQPSVRRISGAADVDNAGSIRVMEKAGLQREKVIRKWHAHPTMGAVPRDYVAFFKVR